MSMKRILSVQDLSCVGRCSLTVALPILSAMGIHCSVLPTAVLSTHTGFPDPHIRSLTEDIVPICQHLSQVGAEFDAISIGYLSSPEQAEVELMETFRCPVILDPVMGDHGKLYKGFTREHVSVLKDLAAMADVVLPNVTEAFLLTGLPYQEQTDGQMLRMMLDMLNRKNTSTVVITGITPTENQIGFVGLDRQEGMFSYMAERRSNLLHGTGDMFSAVFSGAYLLGRDPMEAAQLAADFVARVLENTPKSTPFGGEFETQLPWLWQQL